MKYLLDTNICIYAINQRAPRVVERMQAAGPGELATSVIVAAELAFGVEKSVRPESRIYLTGFLRGLHVLPWPEHAVWHYARLRHTLQRAGTPIGDMDLLIACHALADDLTLVTNNTREFQHVPGLKLENWAA